MAAGMERRGLGVCHECMLMLRQYPRGSQLRFATQIRQQWPRRRYASIPYEETSKKRSQAPAIPSRANTASKVRKAPATGSTPANNTTDITAFHARILELSASALNPEDAALPSEQRVLYVLEQFEAIAAKLINPKSIATAKESRADRDDTTATSALLGSVNARRTPASLSKGALLNTISEHAEQILRHPSVFITPAILKTYVDLQSALHHPFSFPDIFNLYANKPIPRPGSKKPEITFKRSNPDAANVAIPVPVSKEALTAAMASRDLALSVDVILMTFCTTAYKKSKILRKALLPISGLAAAPFAAWGLASHFATHYQNTMSVTYATGIGFTGIMTYVSAVSMLGYITVTTANDHHDRVVWMKGIPLWERWVREEERAAFDRLAGTWGFQDALRRGEEEGAEWEELREFLGLRGLLLDKTSLMEGME